MNDEYDDFKDAIEDIKVERKKNTFQINQLKIEHFYRTNDDVYAGMPISTSIELTKDYNYDIKSIVWIIRVTHNYVSLKDINFNEEDSYIKVIDNDIIKDLEKYDLRDLKNNYFTEEEPDNFTHWELTYNNYFKIVGTYDQSIDEFEKIRELLDFKEIIKNETNKIKDIVESIQ